MDANRFSLIKEHDRHFQVHDKKDNTHFNVAKKSIHPATQMKILKLPKYAEGGDVDDESEATPNSQPQASLPEPAPDMQSAPAQDPMASMQPNLTGQAAPQDWQAPMLPPGEAPPQAAQSAEGLASQAQAAPAASQYAMPGMDQMAQGLKIQAGAQQQLAKAQEDAIRASQQQQAVHELQYQDEYKKITDEQDGLKKQLSEGTVDPKHFWNSKTTGQKIGTALSLILGGIGAGLNHGPNIAMQVMDKAIDQDIQAQKDNLGKTHSLLSLNMQKYHNLQTAEAATRLHYNTVLGMQLQEAQAKAGNGIAQGALQMKLGQIGQQDALYRQQIALNGVRSAQLGGANGDGGIPVGQEPSALLLDPKYREGRVVVNGKAFQANDKEAAAKVRDVETLAGPVVDGVKELRALSDDSTVRIPGSPANMKAHSIMAGLSTRMPLLAGATIGAKRVNEAEVKAQAERFHDPTQFGQALGSIKTDNFLHELEGETESMRRNHLVGYKGMDAVKSFKPAGGFLPLNKQR